jgi:hypothetical protein
VGWGKIDLKIVVELVVFVKWDSVNGAEKEINFLAAWIIFGIMILGWGNVGDAKINWYTRGLFGILCLVYHRYTYNYTIRNAYMAIRYWTFVWSYWSIEMKVKSKNV